MQTNVLEYLEAIVPRFPNKTAFANESEGLTFQEVYDQARAVGSALIAKGYYNSPIVVLMKKHPTTLAAFFGVMYSGNYYVPLDEEMPRSRIELIFQTLNPQAVICDDSTRAFAETFDFDGELCLYTDLAVSSIDEAALAAVRQRQLDVDPIYIVFTSGSTGVPKGVMACHRSVIDYIENLCDVMHYDENTVFGNQTPLYFDAYLKEIMPTLKYGATTYLIPKQLFMFPLKLVEFLNEYKINTVCWVVSALTMISAFRTFDTLVPQYLKTVVFASEMFPMKQFHIWRKALPDARFVNLYGPTEVTGVCCYYEVDREFGLDEVLPIGKPFKNTGILLLDENNQEPPLGEQGEICVRGTCLTLGYYRNEEKTNEAFVQNPLNDRYPEKIYRTGDIGKYNERGELVFLSRKDFQIKSMGHRIELGEIEAVVDRHDDVAVACCIYDAEKKKIVLYYVGAIETKGLMAYIKEKLPRYMVPNVLRKIEKMYYTPNGKIDRNFLKQLYVKGE